jgi:recombination protein RecT
MLGESLKLSPSVQLGQFYLVPFNDRKNGRVVATFQIGYKGYIQLAIRSGQYKKLNVLAIKEGELVSYDPLNEEIEVNLIQDDAAREEAPTIGYYAMFEYVNGFRKTMYWSRERMEAHALRYSQGYAADKRKGNAYTFWSKDFDAMAYKTMLRQIISKWGIMSVDMQQAFAGDNAMIVDGEPQYIDTEPVQAQAATAPAASQPRQPEPAAQEPDDFFSDEESQAQEPEGKSEDPEAIMGEEYMALNAAGRKSNLNETFKGMGVGLDKLEALVGKSYAQWARKERVALIEAFMRIHSGEDPAAVFQAKAAA